MIKLFLKIIAAIFFELMLFAMSYIIWHHQEAFLRAQSPEDSFVETAPLATTEDRFPDPVLAWEEKESKEPLPLSFELPVPFTAQAPYGNWNEPWQNFCEEAVILMTARFHDGYTRQTIPPEEASRSLLSIMRYEQKHLGYNIDTGVDDIASTLKGAYNVPMQVVSNATIEDIKNTVLRYRPVIVPVSGKLLQNPQFLRGGPVYHTVLVIGYDDRDETFITHEPGTRFGKRYRYDQKKLYNAIADWDQRLGLVSKKVIVIPE
ncbi:MAG: hypothetical protein UX72_C0018G0007 [Parcubacteria group bacterium GW2011_GWA2_47_10]|nr:MAG: hypothetical protein UX72_C0018G0007 [Parcubacteria group bacterium GW2011_GWA2_47_10]